MSGKTILAVDGSNVTSGGAVTYVLGLLCHARQCPFDEIVMLIGEGQETLFPGLDPRVRLYVDPALPRCVWLRRTSPTYWIMAARVLWWRRRMLPRRLEQLGAAVLLGANGLLPRRRVAGVRKAVAFHNALPFDPAECARYPLLQRFRLHVLRRAFISAFVAADGIVFLSDWARNAAAATAGLDLDRIRHETVHHGVEHDIFRPPSGERVLSNPTRLLYVSSLEPYKHQLEVVQALALLRDRGHAVTLELAGWEQPEIKRQLQAEIARRGLDQAVIFHGACPRDKLADLYRAGKIFVFASSCENCPTILIEAMASGLPIACADRGPMREIVGDAMAAFDPEDPRSIADTIERLLRDPALCRGLSARSIRRAAEFSWEKSARLTFSFLASLRASVPELSARVVGANPDDERSWPHKASL